MKKLYKRLLRAIEKIPDGLEKFKTFAAEWVAIYKKRPLYKDIKWTKQQQAEFDAFWKKHYGKKISNRWHRLYEACNGVHRVDYMPEWIYSVKLDCKWNNRKYSTVYADKNLLGLLLDGRVAGVRTPKAYLFNCNGCFYDENRNMISAERAKKIMASLGEAVIKPSVDSSSGRGVAILNMQDGKNLRA